MLSSPHILQTPRSETGGNADEDGFAVGMVAVTVGGEIQEGKFDREKEANRQSDTLASCRSSALTLVTSLEGLSAHLLHLWSDT